MDLNGYSGYVRPVPGILSFMKDKHRTGGNFSVFRGAGLLLSWLLAEPAASQTETAGFRCGEDMRDPRDGKTYQTVLIGEQCWMKQNLDVGMMLEAGSPLQPGLPVSQADEITKYCYEDDPSNCEIYGGLYTWEQAMGSGLIEAYGDVCPPGWHLPSKEEWEALALFLGREDAGQKIKASPEDPYPWDGTNESGFSGLPAGAGNGEGYQRLGQWALFWSSSEADGQRAWFAQLDGFWYEQPPKYKIIYIGNYYLKSNMFSVRCLKDRQQK
jgi:uncharacterized protein (TIGR02145 family)